ncbi:MAG: helix-turn-helix domain-containing protein [Planctomycetota bacterium]|nr:MAG: helix-turn-helix domain-containing protein [Planctomycetota bacterium]
MQWRHSGLAIRAFARQVGMCPSTLSTWIRKYLMELSTENAKPDEAISARGFIPAVSPATGSAPAPLVWYLPSGLGAVLGDAIFLWPYKLGNWGTCKRLSLVFCGGHLAEIRIGCIGSLWPLVQAVAQRYLPSPLRRDVLRVVLGWP